MKQLINMLAAKSAEIIKVDPAKIDVSCIKKAADFLRRGKVVAFPTETVYGMGVVFDKQESLKRIYEIKNRSADKPLTLLLAGKEMVRNFSDKIPFLALKLMEAFWPGPLTIILEDEDKQTKGFRVPLNKLALSLLKEINLPLATTSVNVSGGREAVSLSDIKEELRESIDLILDGGMCEIKKASTVIKVTQQGYNILRRGSVSEEQIKEVLSYGE